MKYNVMSILLLLLVTLQFTGCEKSVVSDDEPFKIRMLAPFVINGTGQLSVVLDVPKNNINISSLSDVKVLISNKDINDSLSVIGILKKNGNDVELLGNYESLGIEPLTEFAIIINCQPTRLYSGAFDLEVIIGNHRAKSSEQLTISTKGVKL
ncbi:MAG: hypothetical protein KGZ71_08395 [Desulfobulbaceae bacterium]|nr:hypothetical protein [Desulfobulbaceae bacterium]